MSESKLFESFSQLDPELIERSGRRRPGRFFTGLSVAAACAAVALALALPSLKSPDLPADPSITDPAGPVEPAVTDEPGETPDTGPETPSAKTPEGPEEPSPTEEPPELIYNYVDLTNESAAPAPPVWFSKVTDSPMSAYQLELCWSRDCPTAFLEEGQEDEWYYESNLSGTARYMDTGQLYCLQLIFRERDRDVPAVLTISPVGGPLFTGCAIPAEEERTVSNIGLLECTAYRLDFGGEITLAAEFNIGDARFRVSAKATPETEEDAMDLVYRVVTSFQRNGMIGRYPDLDSFVKDDGKSGDLAGENDVMLLELRDSGGDGWQVYRDGRVEEGHFTDVGTFLTWGERELGREALMELRDIFGDMSVETLSALDGCGHEREERDYLLTPRDPWNRSCREITGCREDNAAVARVLDILEAA